MAKAPVLSSSANPLLKDVRRALERGALTSQGYCVAEGPRLLEEARRSGSKIRAVLVSESAQGGIPERGEPFTAVSDRVFSALAATENTQGVIALVEPPSWSIERLFGPASLVVVLDAVRDPGNAGTIVRAAEAFGATGVIFVKGSAAPFNAKVLRASAGSLFRIPFVHGVEAADALALLKDEGVTLYAGVPDANATPLARADLTSPCALIVGNEGAGVSEAFRSAARGLTIPTSGVESLNAAIAAAVILYEASRRRSAAS